MDSILRVKMLSIKDNFEGSSLCINKHICEVMYENMNFKSLLNKNDFIKFFDKDSCTLVCLEALLQSILCDNQGLDTELCREVKLFDNYSDEVIFKILASTTKELNKKILISISDYYRDSISLKSENSKLLFEKYSRLVLSDICYQVLFYMSKTICERYKTPTEFFNVFGTKCKDTIINIFEYCSANTEGLDSMLLDVLINDYGTIEFGLKIIEEFERCSKVGNN